MGNVWDNKRVAGHDDVWVWYKAHHMTTQETFLWKIYLRNCNFILKQVLNDLIKAVPMSVPDQGPNLNSFVSVELDWILSWHEWPEPSRLDSMLSNSCSESDNYSPEPQSVSH